MFWPLNVRSCTQPEQTPNKATDAIGLRVNHIEAITHKIIGIILQGGLDHVRFVIYPNLDLR